MRFRIFTYLLIIISLLNFSLLGQETGNDILINDTIKWPDSKTSTSDTIFVNNKTKSDLFYDSLITKASRNKITKTALDFLLVSQPNKGKYIGIENLKNEDYYQLYAGKIIRNIEIIKLDVFGPSLTDTSQTTNQWFQKAGNKTHTKTHDFIIKNNLFFQEGDSIDPLQLSDNERLIRKLDYIKDVSIQIAEIPNNPNYVDVLIITKDVYSAGIYIDLYNSTSGAVEIYENNLAGIGHNIQLSGYFSSIESIPFGYKLNYKIENIGKSFIKSNIQYINAFETEKYEINLSRKFVSYNTKWAGSLSLEKTSTLKDIKKTDTILSNVRLNFSTQDIWLGRSFKLNSGNIQYQNRTRLVLGFRYINNYFYKGPEVSERYNFQYHNNQIALASIAFSQQKHYKSNLIYGFGKTEDIPIGILLQLNTGLEKDEFFRRIYLGLKFSKGIYYPKIGYLNIHSEIGGHFYENQPEQGAFRINTETISNLHYFNKLKFRGFLSIDYIKGINRFSDEGIYLNSTNIWGLESDYLFGLQKISFNSEIVVFTNMYIYNFRFLFFGFGDIGMVGHENQSLFKQNLYSGIGLGFRIRNENLVFKTFQIRLAFYPTIPADSEQFYFLLSGENYQKPINFEPTAPSTIEYR